MYIPDKGVRVKRKSAADTDQPVGVSRTRMLPIGLVELVSSYVIGNWLQKVALH